VIVFVALLLKNSRRQASFINRDRHKIYRSPKIPDDFWKRSLYLWRHPKVVHLSKSIYEGGHFIYRDTQKLSASVIILEAQPSPYPILLPGLYMYWELGFPPVSLTSPISRSPLSLSSALLSQLSLLSQLAEARGSIAAPMLAVQRLWRQRLGLVGCGLVLRGSACAHGNGRASLTAPCSVAVAGAHSPVLRYGTYACGKVRGHVDLSGVGGGWAR
jgi:hypothetical protein